MSTRFTSPAPVGTAPATTNALAAPPRPGTLKETRFLAVDGGRIAYDDTGGNGPLILAIPGMGDLRSGESALVRETYLEHRLCRTVASVVLDHLLEQSLPDAQA